MKVTLLSYSVVNDCCKVQRILWPLQYLHNQGKIELNVSYLSMIPLFSMNKEKMQELLDMTEVLIIQRPITEIQTLERFIELVTTQRPDISIILEYDDWLWEDAEDFMKQRFLFERFPVICSTLTLANYIKTLIPSSKLFVYQTKVPYQENHSSNDFSSSLILHTGTKTHFHDIQNSSSVFNKFLFKYGEAKMLFWGSESLELFNNSGGRIMTRPFVSDYEKYFKQFLSLDCKFGINPLIPTRKNWAKSGIKFIEYGLKGIPALFQDMPEYRRIVPIGLDFLLFNDNNFFEKMEMLYTMEEEKLREIGKIMWETVVEHHVMTEESMEDYLTIIKQCNTWNLGGFGA